MTENERFNGRKWPDAPAMRGLWDDAHRLETLQRIFQETNTWNASDDEESSYGSMLELAPWVEILYIPVSGEIESAES